MRSSPSLQDADLTQTATTPKMAKRTPVGTSDLITRKGRPTCRQGPLACFQVQTPMSRCLIAEELTKPLVKMATVHPACCS